MIELIVSSGEPREYFCNGCGQLRFDVAGDRTTCGNCGGASLVFGVPGALDKSALIKAMPSKAAP